jgi:hypothetical protein
VHIASDVGITGSILAGPSQSANSLEPGETLSEMQPKSFAEITEIVVFFFSKSRRRGFHRLKICVIRAIRGVFAFSEPNEIQKGDDARSCIVPLRSCIKNRRARGDPCRKSQD